MEHIPTKTVLIVEDNIPTKERMEQIIIQSEHFELTDSVSTVMDAKRVLKLDYPNILLTDLDLPDGDGTELIELIQSEPYQTELAIVISVFGDEDRVFRAINAGASGYLLKGDPCFEIVQALEEMVMGGSPISPTIARKLLKFYSSMPELTKETQVKRPKLVLSKREQQVLTLFSKGLTAKEIGDMLEISHHTVSSHIKKIYKKMSVSNKAEAIYEASKFGLI